MTTLMIAIALFLAVSCPLSCEEVFDTRLEAEHLKNVTQQTFQSMGFEKAGEAYFSPDDKSIIFQAVPIGREHYQIYTMQLDKLVPRLISTGKGACTCPYYRPDGKKVIYASSHEDPALDAADFKPEVPGYKRTNGQYVWDFTPYMNIYEADPDGSHLKALTHGPHYTAECAYSDDGQRIVFACNESGSMNLYTMNADGSDRVQITSTTECYNGGPFFSPDGKQVIFRSDRKIRHYLQLYVIDSDGQNERQLTDNGAVNWAPYWHPNGHVVAFTTSLHGHSHYEIYLLDTLSGKEVRLTHNPTFDGLPVFSHDGTKLMWTSKRGSDTTSQIFIADFTMPQNLH